MPSSVSQRKTRMLSMLPRRGRFRQLLEMLVEARAQNAPLGALGAGARKDDEVPRRQRALMAKRFAGQSLELVAVHGAFRSSARDGQTEARGGTAGRSCENGEEPIARTRRLGEHSPELCRRVQSLVGRKPCRAGLQRRAKTESVKA